MKILHIGLSSMPGGIESFALNYFYELKKYGVIFDFADIYGNGIARSDEIEALGGKIFTFLNFKKHPIRTKRELSEFIKKNKYDSVHIHMQTAANMIPVLAAKDAGVVPIVHCHVSAAEGLVRKALHGFFVPYLRKLHLQRVACGSDAGKWLWGNNAFDVIPNAVDLNKYRFSKEKREKIRRLLGFAEDKIVLGFVGRLEIVKNPLFVLELAKQFVNIDSDFQFVILGAGSLQKQMEEYVLQEKLGANVKLLGYKEKVDEYLCAFDIYLMPSIHEAVSVAAVEAQINGLCCLISDTVPHEVKLSEKVSFLKLNDLNEWTQAIKALKKDISLNEREMSINECIYDISVSSQKLLKLYGGSI